MPDPLSSPEEYQAFVYNLPDRFPSIRQSTLIYVPSGELFGRVEGLLVFDRSLVLCVQEYLNFELGVIEGYGYEASTAHFSLADSIISSATEYCQSRYQRKEKLYWYDSFPHPNDPVLETTDPHHIHIPPNIRHHRIAAPDLSFTRPNLPFLIREIERLLKEKKH
jgi:hypothetical protein